MDNEVWRWVWVGVTLVMALGEIVTAGFFLLPFAVGGALAAVAAWIGLPGFIHWVLFFVGTGIAMWVVRRFMRSQDEENGLLIGPARYVGMNAVILEEVNMDANTGLIRVEAEEWRAITDGAPYPGRHFRRGGRGARHPAGGGAVGLETIRDGFFCWRCPNSLIYDYSV